VTIGTPPLLAGLSVLVIEDDQDTLDMFEAYLHYCGAQVTAMRSAEQALAYLSRRRVDAITTDVSVDPRRGAAFVSQVRSRPGCDGTPVIAVTGWAAKDFDHIGAGFTAFMHKPIELDDLAGTLRRLARPT
jgi:two-component system, chemotaxis family, CheB/CheR fusion protein